MSDVVIHGYSFASRFFAGPNGGINYNFDSCNVNLSPSPTKLLPKPEKYESGVIIELSVVLHGENVSPKWRDGCLPCGGNLPFGCIDFKLTEAFGLGLNCVLDPKDWSDSHANIRGWPDDVDDQMEMAIILARKSTLIIYDGSIGRLLKYCANKYLTYVQPACLIYDALRLLVYMPVKQVQ